MYINYFGLILEYKPRNLVFLQNAKASISNFRGYLKTAVADVTVVCKIPLLARRTRPKAARPSARATIGYLVYKRYRTQ